MLSKTVKTRLAEGQPQVETAVTLDFAGVTQEEMEKLAAATAIINEQAIWRTSGKIPASATIKVREQLDSPRGGGFKVTPENVAAKVLKMSDEDRAKVLEMLGAKKHK